MWCSMVGVSVNKLFVRSACASGVVCFGVLAGSTAAYAAGSSGAYPPSPIVKGETFTIGPNQAVAPQADPGGSALPFTGIDMGYYLAGGAVLVAGGTALTLVSRRRRHDGAGQ